MGAIRSLKLCAKVFAIAILTIILLFAALAVFYCPVYHFPEPKTFHGENWYNPYEGLDGTNFHRANFQVQSKAWSGITNGEKNSNQKIFERYDSLGYDIIAISDYMKINPYCHPGKHSLNAYEHGYGIRKTHQLCLGAQKVSWLDYPVVQTRSSKQHILNTLSNNSKVVCIAHPSLRNAYTLEDMKYLEGYHLIESISHFARSFEYWDAALSAGKPVFLIANDDAHNMDNPYDYGRVLTLVHTKSLEEDSVYSSLIAGKAYGYEVYTPDDISITNKPDLFKKLAKLDRCQVRNDSLLLATDSPISEVKFITQDGRTKEHKVFNQSDVYACSHNIGDVSTYVRAEITMKNRDVIYLNPIFRYDQKPLARSEAHINGLATAFVKLSGIILLLFPLVLIGIRQFRKRTPSPELSFPRA
jgi:hypothetical protein